MRVAFATLCITLTCLAYVGAAHAEAPPVAGHVSLAIDAKSTFTDYARSGQRLEYVVLQTWQAHRMNQLKAANPNLKVLVYKNLLASEAQGYPGYSGTGVSYEEAEAHPEWFLTNTNGERFTLRNYPYQWAMDIGSSSYQQRWAENVTADVETQGWDGVFIDNVNPTIKYSADVSSIARYRSDAAYAAATQSALAAITPRLRATHKLVFANFGSWVESGYNAEVSSWLRYVDGAMDEMFVKFSPRAGVGYRPETQWARQLDELKKTQREGKVFLAVTHSADSDRAAARYGWASVLLGAGGHAAYEMAETYADETWFPEYDYDIGQASGSEFRASNGVYHRLFAHGLVLVNPTATARSVSFGGTYTGSGLTDATGVTMPPQTGLVLLRDAP